MFRVWVFCLCVYVHILHAVSTETRKGHQILWNSGVWELNPGPLLEQPVPFSTELSLQPGLVFWGEVSLCGPCRPGTWNNPLWTSRELGWQMCRSYLQPGWFWFWFWCLRTCFFIGRKKKSSYFKSFPRKTTTTTTLLFATSAKWSVVSALSSVVCVMVAKLNQELPDVLCCQMSPSCVEVSRLCWVTFWRHGWGKKAPVLSRIPVLGRY